MEIYDRNFLFRIVINIGALRYYLLEIFGVKPISRTAVSPRFTAQGSSPRFLEHGLILMKLIPAVPNAKKEESIVRIDFFIYQLSKEWREIQKQQRLVVSKC